MSIKPEDSYEKLQEALADVRRMKSELKEARATQRAAEERRDQVVAEAERSAEQHIATATAEAGKIVRVAQERAALDIVEARKRVEDLQGRIQSRRGWARKLGAKVEQRLAGQLRELEGARSAEAGELSASEASP